MTDDHQSYFIQNGLNQLSLTNMNYFDFQMMIASKLSSDESELMLHQNEMIIIIIKNKINIITKKLNFMAN